MEQNSETKISAAKLKNFFMHLAVTQKKLSQKQGIKSDISDRIEKIKELSSGARQKSAVMEELEKLEKKVSEIVEMQVKARTDNDAMLQKLQEKIGMIKPSAKPFEDFERISSRLSENVLKLNKVGAIEQNIENEVREEKSEIEMIEDRLKVLESKFREMKASKKAKKSDLERVQALIEKHKRTIKEIKAKQ